MDSSTQATDAGPQKAGGNVRWVICALLFFATTINYIDRQVIGILKPTLQGELGWSEVDYGMIVFWFQAAYAIGLLACGPIIDKIGSKMGYAAAITLWSLAALCHALVRTPGGFSIARFALGLGEAANFPAAIKSVAEWFPTKGRALAAAACCSRATFVIAITASRWSSAPSRNLAVSTYWSTTLPRRR